MQRPLAILTGLTLLTLVAGCGTATKVTPPQGANRTVINAYTPKDTVPPLQEKNTVNAGGASTGSPTVNPTAPSITPGGASVGTPETLPLATQDPGALTAASFVTDKVGLIASAKGIYLTTDGGITWTEVYNSPDPIIGLVATHETVKGQSDTFAWAWTKDYMLASFGVAANFFLRAEFDGHHVPKMGNVPIEDAAFASGNSVVFVSNGVVWSSDNVGIGWVRRTPPVPVASVAAVNANTWYAATTSGAIYKTTDGGQQWTKVFSAPIRQGLGWNAQLKAAGNHVAILYTSSDVTQLHQPYVLYDSNDGGQTWNNLFNESSFQDYGSLKPLYPQALSLRAGPFALLPNGNVAMIGMQKIDHVVPTLSVVTPAGKRIVFAPIGASGNSSDVFGQSGMPTAISAPDASHFFVVGSSGGKAVLEVSNNGGATWTAK